MMTPAAMTMTVSAVRSAYRGSPSPVVRWRSLSVVGVIGVGRMDNDLDRADDDKLDIAGLDSKPIRYRPDQGNISQWVVMGLCWDRIVGGPLANAPPGRRVSPSGSCAAASRAVELPFRQPYCTLEAGPCVKITRGHTFSSCLSSLKKRQSVCSSIIFCGLVWIISTSRIRSA